MTITSSMVTGGLLAHRGASLLFPENTIEALRAAAEMGAEFVETDVQFTRDNKLVIIHDSTLDRTTTGSGHVALSELGQIQALDAGSWKDTKFTGYKVPTLEQYLDCVLELGLGLQLELKGLPGGEDHLVDLVVAELKNYLPSLNGKFFVSSFSERCLQGLANRLPDVKRAVAVAPVPIDPDAYAKQINVDIIHVQDAFVDADALARIKSSDVEIGVATINKKSRAQFLLSSGVRQVLTDNPRLLADDELMIAANT